MCKFSLVLSVPILKWSVLIFPLEYSCIYQAIQVGAGSSGGSLLWAVVSEWFPVSTWFLGGALGPARSRAGVPTSLEDLR